MDCPGMSADQGCGDCEIKPLEPGLEKWIQHLQTLIIFQESGCQFRLGELSILDRFGLVEFRHCLQLLAQDQTKK